MSLTFKETLARTPAPAVFRSGASPETSAGSLALVRAGKKTVMRDARVAFSAGGEELQTVDRFDRALCGESAPVCARRTVKDQRSRVCDMDTARVTALGVFETGAGLDQGSKGAPAALRLFHTGRGDVGQAVRPVSRLRGN